MSQDFFTPAEETAIVKAIQLAETHTSGEIRVHIEPVFEGDVMDRAKAVFNELKMYQTEQRNGVLFYVATKTRKFALLGDKGIYEKVPEDFWESTKNKVIKQFKQGAYAQGLIEGIQEAGIQLKTYFAYDHSNDQNELTDEISKG